VLDRIVRAFTGRVVCDGLVFSVCGGAVFPCPKASLTALLSA
jgi:hypothetical protein